MAIEQTQSQQKYEPHVLEMARANRDDIKQALACGKLLTDRDIARWNLYNEVLGEEPIDAK